MLRYKIDKTAFEKLPKDVQAEYKSEGDGYILDIDGSEVAAEALSARDNMKKERDEAKKAADDAKKASDDTTAKITKLEKDLQSAKEANGKDVQAVTQSYEAKIADLSKERDAANAKFDDFQKNSHKSQIVDKLAGEISTAPALMGRVIADRISVELIDGKPVERVLDKDGKPSALSLGDLRKEIVDNPEYKSVIKVSNASGGGAPQRTNGGGAPVSTSQQNQNADVATLPTPDLRARVEARREANKG